MQKLLLVASLLIGLAMGQSDNTLDIDSIRDQFPGLDKFNETALPQKEEIEKIFREKCKKNGNEGAFDEIMNSKDKIQKCFEEFVNTTVIQAELDEAKKDGSMDEVFGKYCNKRSQIMDCITELTGKIDKCLDPEERDNLKIVMNVTESLADFICFKNGDRLAMFVAQGGFECLQDHKDELQQCVNTTLSGKIPSDLSINNLPLLIIGDKECDDMVKIQECTVTELEKCTDSTPANIVEALFKFIKRVTPCSAKPAVARNPRYLDEAIQILDRVKRTDQVEFSFIHSFNGKCRKYAGPKAYGDLEASVQNLKGCVQAHLRSPNACARLPSEVRNCTNAVINKLRVCLPPQESYLPNFAHSSVDSVLHYICDNNGDNFNKFIYSNGLHCLFTSDPKSLNDCLEGTKTRRTTDSDVVSKAELCEDLTKVQLCLSTYITNHCSDQKEFKQVTMGLMDAFKAPCAGCSLFVNNAILLLSLFFTLRKLL